ncbi:hypothetical protein HDV00_001623 [Rhizophlyctis rosea]|nr:hypothetical protein HDV00_001623 [Rhizophlyctis rosea]
MEELQIQYNIQCGVNDIVDLESSTTEKFSRHLIVHTPNAVFKDNAHVGAFVKNLSARILHFTHNSQPPQPSPPPHHHEAHELLILDKGSRKLFIDDGVYSRNRNFRVWLSSKIGKSVALEVAGSSGKKPICGRDLEGGAEDEAFFLNSLVCAVEYRPGMKILRAVSSESEEVVRDRGAGVRKTEHVTPISQTYDTSPYPLIDEYILQSIRNRAGSDRAVIKSCCYFAYGQAIVYNIVGDRYCFNVGRQHKSNGVYYVADLKNGVYNQRVDEAEGAVIIGGGVELTDAEMWEIGEAVEMVLGGDVDKEMERGVGGEDVG